MHPTWSLLSQTESIMHAQWPEASTVDPLLLKESEYLTQVSHEFRVRIKKMVDLREKASARDVGPQSSVICIFAVNNHLYHVTILHVLCEIATTPTRHISCRTSGNVNILAVTRTCSLHSEVCSFREDREARVWGDLRGTGVPSVAAAYPYHSQRAVQRGGHVIGDSV